MSSSDSNASIAPQSVSCKKCQKPIQILDQAQTCFVGCSHCGAYYEVNRINRKGSRFIRKFSVDYSCKTDPVWALATRITLRETKYALIAFVVKKEENKNVYWREYTLFNPIHGYAFLAEYNGHWILLKAATEHPAAECFNTRAGRKTVKAGDGNYRWYHQYKAQVVYAQGEFSYNVTRVVQCTEYVRPPYLMTREAQLISQTRRMTPQEVSGNELLAHMRRMGSETTPMIQEVIEGELCWYKGEYLSPEEVSEASPEMTSLPQRIGVGACQPNPHKRRYRESAILSLLAILLLVLLDSLLTTSAKETEEVLRESYFLQDSFLYNTYAPAKEKPIITPSFSMAEEDRNIEITLNSPVDNSWFEAEITLVNEQTGAEQYLNMGVEYYHGNENLESWSEGTIWATEMLSAVPAGHYHLMIVPTKPTQTANFEVVVNKNVPTGSNFWITLIIISIVFIYYYIRYLGFEVQRWKE